MECSSATMAAAAAASPHQQFSSQPEIRDEKPKQKRLFCFVSSSELRTGFCLLFWRVLCWCCCYSELGTPSDDYSGATAAASGQKLPEREANVEMMVYIARQPKTVVPVFTGPLSSIVS